jgi:GxxExxY protein
MLHHEGTKHTKATKALSLALSHQVIGAAIEVHRLLGPGLLESLYEVALCKELRLRGMIVDRQISMPVKYKGEVLDCNMKLDLLVEKSIIVTGWSPARSQRMKFSFVPFVFFVPSW